MAAWRSTAALAVAVAATALGAAGGARAEAPWAVTIDGGLGQYTGALGSATKLGGVWGVRAERVLLPGLQVGLAYVGGANQVGPGTDLAQPVLQRDGGEASAKWLLLGAGGFTPYLEAGAGLARFHPRNGDPGPGVHAATTFVVPVGAGVQAGAGVLRFGAGVGGELLLGDKPVDPGGGVRLEATVHLGARF